MQAYELLERDLAAWAGNPNMVVCNSGTAALHLALEALKIPAGSECLCPEFTFVACARAIVLAGLTPVFVDCGEDLLIDPSLFVDAYRICAPEVVLWVHLYGRRCDVEPEAVGPFGESL